MDWGLAIANVLNPAALFFALGFAAVLLKTDLEIPAPLPKLFSLYLIIAIGYTGGTKLAASGLSGTVILYIAATMFMALLVPIVVFFVLRKLLSVYDAAAMRHAVPESNPGLVEIPSLGITFPFNITRGKITGKKS